MTVQYYFDGITIADLVQLSGFFFAGTLTCFCFIAEKCVEYICKHATIKKKQLSCVTGNSPPFLWETDIFNYSMNVISSSRTYRNYILQFIGAKTNFWYSCQFRCHLWTELLFEIFRIMYVIFLMEHCLEMK